MATRKVVHQSRVMKHYAAVVVAYTVLSLIIPLSRETREAYNLSLAEAHIVALISVVPLFGVWFAAFYCYGLLQKYARSIHKANEGFAFKRLSQGVMVLSWGLVVQAFASLILGGLADQFSGFRGAAVIIQNYLTLAFPLFAFSAIAVGTRHLLTDKHNYVSLPTSRFLLLLFAFIGTIYSYLSFHLRENADGAVYYLPTFLFLTTILIPYLYAWFSGLIAAYDISLYARITDGLLYKRSLNLLSVGLIVLIVASILMQYLNSVFLSSVGTISINAVLLADYLLLMGVALGYVLMIIGVRGLQKIEEI